MTARAMLPTVADAETYYGTLTEPQQREFIALVALLVARRRAQKLQRELEQLVDELAEKQAHAQSKYDDLARWQNIALQAADRVKRARADEGLRVEETDDCYQPSYSGNPF
jgi:NhaP-type Na+/H+ and K+/H+ antiporter